MVCYYFPPLGGIGSLRALKFASYLPEFDWAPTVLAPATGAYYRDTTLQFPENNVVRSFSLELSRIGKRVFSVSAGDTKPATVTGLSKRIRDAFRHTLYRPDGQRGWYPFALHAGRRLLREHRFDAIFSTSYPVTAHAIARTLSRESGLPWVAEFRDPFVDELPPGDGRLASSNRLEAAILKDASAVVAPSPSWAELFRAKGGKKTTVITNGCDPSDLPSAQRQPDQFVLSHLGSFMPERQDLDTALRALASLRRTELPDARLRLIGDAPTSVMAKVGEVGLGAAVEVTGFLPQREALARLWSSTALFLAGATGSDLLSRGWIPGKTFEYLATGLPILYVGTRRADVAHLLANHDGTHLISPGQEERARESLLMMSRSARVSRSLKGITRRDGTRILSGLLDRVVAGPKRRGESACQAW